MMKSQAYWINAEKREITAVLYGSTDDIRKFVGGSSGFQLGGRLGDNSESHLYLGDEALYEPSPQFFWLRAPYVSQQPLRGNALVVGPDYHTMDATRPPTLTLEALRGMVDFGSWDDACAWVAAHAEEAAVAINGETVMTWARFWRDVPPPAMQRA